MKFRSTFIAVTLSLGSALLSQSFAKNASPTSNRTVTGTEIVHYKDANVPIDLSGVPVAAYVPNGAGGYNVIQGSGTSAGTFSIANVPTGGYLLQLGSSYLATSASAVDADYLIDERSTGVRANPGTTVTFDLTNLHAWQSTDVFEMVCPNNGEYNVYPGTVGETSFTGSFNYFGHLSDASQGDKNYILQLITQNVRGYPFTAAGRGFLATFTQQQGSNTLIDGRLATIPQTHSFEANINGADLTAQALAANPNALLADTVVVLDVYPGSLAQGENTSTSDLLDYDASAGQPFLTNNADLGKVSYGNPFPPSSWPLFDVYSWVSYALYVAPGATNAAAITAQATGYNTSLPTPSSPIRPLIGVVTNPTINGVNFFTDQVGTGLTPTLKWSVPGLGKATFYDVQIFELSNDSGNTNTVQIASIRTSGTTLAVPQGLLASGFGYVFLIRPWYSPGTNLSKYPYVYGPTLAIADVISGLMQP